MQSPVGAQFDVDLSPVRRPAGGALGPAVTHAAVHGPSLVAEAFAHVRIIHRSAIVGRAPTSISEIRAKGAFCTARSDK